MLREPLENKHTTRFQKTICLALYYSLFLLLFLSSSPPHVSVSADTSRRLELAARLLASLQLPSRKSYPKVREAPLKRRRRSTQAGTVRCCCVFFNEKRRGTTRSIDLRPEGAWAGAVSFPRTRSCPGPHALRRLRPRSLAASARAIFSSLSTDPFIRRWSPFALARLRLRRTGGSREVGGGCRKDCQDFLFPPFLDVQQCSTYSFRSTNCTFVPHSLEWMPVSY